MTKVIHQKQPGPTHVVFFYLFGCLYTVCLFTFWLQDGNISAATNFRITVFNTRLLSLFCLCCSFVMLTGILNPGGSVELILNDNREKNNKIIITNIFHKYPNPYFFGGGGIKRWNNVACVCVCVCECMT